MPEERRVKNHKLFEGLSPSFYDLVTRVRHPKNAHGVSELDLLRNHQGRADSAREHEPEKTGPAKRRSSD